MPLRCRDSSLRRSSARSGEVSSSKTSLQTKERPSGDAIWRASIRTQRNSCLKWPTGDPHTVSGPARHSAYSQPTPDGSTCPQTPCSCITCSPDSKGGSPAPSTSTPTDTRAPSTIGSMNTLQTRSTTCTTRCSDGSDGRTVPTCYWLTSQRLDGTTFKTEESTPTPTPAMVSTLPSMFIIITYTPMLTRSQERKEARKERPMDSSYQSDSSHPKTNGSERVIMIWELLSVIRNNSLYLNG